MKSINKPYSPEYQDSFFEIKQEVNNEGVFTGLGSVFDDRPDESFMRDIMRPGSFQKTIRKGGRNGNGVVMLSQHGIFNLNPVGLWPHVAEVEKGLDVRGELITDGSKHAINGKGTQLANETHVVMKARALRGLSVGFDFPRTKSGSIKDGVIEHDRDRGVRFINEVDLWEISIVTFPAKKNANIGNVKSILDSTTARELETALKNSGISKKEALYLTKLCKDGLRESDDIYIQKMSMILETLKTINY